MASAVGKKPCAKCSKGAAVTTCDGCQQSLCTKHFIEHRQELSHKMENVGQEHDFLQHDLNQQNAEHPLLLQINTWEQESITKIQVAAEAARADLGELLDRNKKELKKSVNKITNELQSCREADDYTEIEINKWTEQLKALRKTLESPPTIHVDENETPESRIRLLLVRDQQQYRSSDCTTDSLQYLSSADGISMSSSSSSNERYDVADEKGIVSEEGLMVTCTANSMWSHTVIYGRNQYSSGTHHMHFRIGKIGRHRIFLGICRFSEKMSNDIDQKQSRCGWWDVDKVVVNSRVQEYTDETVFRIDDEVTLILDCEKRQIQLQHHRTKRLVQQTIGLKNCPFPWNLVVMLKGEGDSIRILQ